MYKDMRQKEIEKRNKGNKKEKQKKNLSSFPKEREVWTSNKKIY